MFDIKPEDSLLLLADLSRGIAIQRMDHFDRLAAEIFLNAADVQAQPDEEALAFAQAVTSAAASREDK